jgi:hypothetical protein
MNVGSERRDPAFRPRRPSRGWGGLRIEVEDPHQDLADHPPRGAAAVDVVAEIGGREFLAGRQPRQDWRAVSAWFQPFARMAATSLWAKTRDGRLAAGLSSGCVAGAIAASAGELVITRPVGLIPASPLV